MPPRLSPVQCVPFVMPEHWASGAICEDLPGYTIHSEASMRQVRTFLPAWLPLAKGLAGLQPQHSASTRSPCMQR